MFRIAGLLAFCLIFSVAATGSEVSVLDFGAVPDDGQDDSAAFQAAVAGGGTVRVPKGTFNLKMSGGAVRCYASTRLVGDGRDRTVLQCEDKLTAGGFALWFAVGTRGELRGLSIVGPSDVGEFGANMVVHYGGSSASLRIDDCRIGGGLVAVKIEEQESKQDQPRLAIMDSVIESRCGILMLNSGYCDLVRTEFRKYGIVGSNQDHAVYVYPPIRLVVDRCVFGGNLGGGYEVHPYSAKVTGKGSVTIRETEFGPSAAGLGILTHPETLTVIRGCRLGGTPICVQRGGVVIAECSLKDRGQVRPWPYSPPGPGAWTLRDCRYGE